jgi:hypothetical protein
VPRRRQGARIRQKTEDIFNRFFEQGGIHMDSTTIIRIVAGVLFVIVLVILIQRRRTRIK